MIIKSFKLFESHSDIHKICQQYDIKDYSINPDGSIDVDGDVYLCGGKLSRLPLEFRHVSGNFYCHNNQLTSLQGCPESVGGGFYCYSNQLTSLEGCPESVGEGFYCDNNQLTNLEGCPRSVGGNFDCAHNQLTSLQGCPESVDGDFSCYYNPVSDIYKLFKTFKCIEWLNEYDVIQGDSVIYQRLMDVYHELGMKVPDRIELKNYKMVY